MPASTIYSKSNSNKDSTSKYEKLRALTTAGLFAVSVFALFYGGCEYDDRKKVTRTMESINFYRQFTGNSSENNSYINKQIQLATKVRDYIPTIRCDYVVDTKLSLPIPIRNVDTTYYCNSGDKIFRDYLERTLGKNNFVDYYSKMIVKKTQDLRVDFFDLLGHYQVVAKCVEHDACDGNTAFSSYSRYMIVFINISCNFFANEAKVFNMESAADRDIVKFLKRYGKGELSTAKASCNIVKSDGRAKRDQFPRTSPTISRKIS